MALTEGRLRHGTHHLCVQSTESAEFIADNSINIFKKKRKCIVYTVIAQIESLFPFNSGGFVHRCLKKLRKYQFMLK